MDNTFDLSFDRLRSRDVWQREEISVNNSENLTKFYHEIWNENFEFSL